MPEKSNSLGNKAADVANNADPTTGLSWVDIFGSPGPSKTDNLFQSLDRKIYQAFDGLEKDLLEFEKGDDYSGYKKYLKTSLDVTGNFAQRSLNILRSKLTIQSVACCLLMVLVRMHQSDRDWIKNSGIPFLVSIRAIAQLLLESMRKGLKATLFDIAFNLVKTLYESLYELAAGLYFILVTELKRTVLQRLLAWIRKGNREVLRCFGFVSLVSLLIDTLVSKGNGLLRKMRTLVVSAAMRWRKRGRENSAQFNHLETIKVLEWIIYICTTLMEAINTGLLCSRTAYDPTYDTTNQGSNPPGEPPVPPTEEGKIIPRGGGRSPSPEDDIRRKEFAQGVSAGSLNINSSTGGSIGVPTVDVSQFFYEPSTEEVARYLTKYIGVPQQEAKRAAEAAATGKCLGQLSEADRMRVETIFKQLGMKL